MLTDLDIREGFHCVLVAHLPASFVAAPETAIAPLRLKGGVNLRLFHDSPRYSEDIDFDLSPIRGSRFAEHLRKLLEVPGTFKRHLLKLGIQQLELSDLDGGDAGFKQKLRIVAGGVQYPTKVEVSYSEETAPAEAQLRAIPAALCKRYQLPTPVRVAAYPAPTALWQKVLALSRRALPQTRDVFDIDQLQKSAGTEATAAGMALVRSRMRIDQVSAAADAVVELTRDQFIGQTAAYLPDTIRADMIAGWPDMQHRVWDALARLLDSMRAERAAPREARDAKV